MLSTHLSHQYITSKTMMNMMIMIRTKGMTTPRTIGRGSSEAAWKRQKMVSVLCGEVEGRADIVRMYIPHKCVHINSRGGGDGVGLLSSVS